MNIFPITATGLECQGECEPTNDATWYITDKVWEIFKGKRDLCDVCVLYYLLKEEVRQCNTQ